jgi:hypothetical protein
MTTILSASIAKVVLACYEFVMGIADGTGNSALKWLIGGACCVAICAGGIFIFEKWSAYSKASADTARLQRARQELFTLAGADPGEERLVRGLCQRTSDRLSTDLKGNSTAEAIARNCRAFGYL